VEIGPRPSAGDARALLRELYLFLREKRAGQPGGAP
jgi:hypothetical protein